MRCITVPSRPAKWAGKPAKEFLREIWPLSEFSGFSGHASFVARNETLCRQREAHILNARGATKTWPSVLPAARIPIPQRKVRPGIMCLPARHRDTECLFQFARFRHCVRRRTRYARLLQALPHRTPSDRQPSPLFFPFTTVP